jgi:hypothetical protein
MIGWFSNLQKERRLKKGCPAVCFWVLLIHHAGFPMLAGKAAQSAADERNATQRFRSLDYCLYQNKIIMY